jgi:ProP effector
MRVETKTLPMPRRKVVVVIPRRPPVAENALRPPTQPIEPPARAIQRPEGDRPAADSQIRKCVSASAGATPAVKAGEPIARKLDAAKVENGKPSERKLAIQRMRRFLAETFPACFMSAGAAKFPLRIGIYHDVLAQRPDLDCQQLHNALGDYTSEVEYLMAMTENAVRIDLNGRPAGLVSLDHATVAEERLNRARHRKPHNRNNGKYV